MMFHLFTRNEILVFLVIFIPMLLIGPNNFSAIDTGIPTEQKWYIGTEKKGITLHEIQGSPLRAIFTYGDQDYLVPDREWVTMNGETLKILIYEYENPPYVWVKWKTETWIGHSLLSLIIGLGTILVLRAIRVKNIPVSVS